MPQPHLTPDQVEALARRAHDGQTDKAGRPYAEHLQAVADGVRARGGSDEQIAAAWLHDAVEDGALSPRWLADAPLAPQVKDMVLALTKRPGEAPADYAARILAVPGPSSSRRPTSPTTPTRTASPSWTRLSAPG